MKRIINFCYVLKKINVLQFCYLNYICKSVIRRDKSKIIPYRHSVIDIHKNAKIIIENGDLEIGCNLCKGSKAETRLRLYENSKWYSRGGAEISYGSTIELLSNAVFESNYFTINCDSVMVVSYKLFIGCDVMIGRNVIVYDSDYHQIIDENNQEINHPEEVYIGNHVWIATNVFVQKGSIIGDNCIISGNSVVKGSVEANCVYKTIYEIQEKKDYGTWNRKSPQI